MRAERVRQLLALRGQIKRARRPLVAPEETDLRLALDRVFCRLRDRGD